MIKPFFLLLSFLLLLMTSVFLHHSLYDGKEQMQMQNQIVSITKIASPALSVAYYEPRILLHEQAVNPAYPQMQTINKMDLVYGK